MSLRKTIGSKFGRPIALIFLLAIPPAAASSSSSAQECPGHPDAIGTSRLIAVDPGVLPQVGTVQYPQTLPLRDHEVVLTFDDGPVTPSTGEVLDALAAQCVQANFFVVGEHARAAPELVRREHDEGHTVGTHTQTHADLTKLAPADAEQEIQAGFNSAQAALGGERIVAPFFRAPYLATTPAVEHFLSRHGVMLWSIDADPEDWRPSTPDEVVDRVLLQLEKNHSGIVLLHDVQWHTAAALPKLLGELKSHGYSIAHVVYGKAAQASAGD
jgi:peptidoglycan/xylan/chitin deacetylase (PgdA/CDA1 family)